MARMSKELSLAFDARASPRRPTGSGGRDGLRADSRSYLPREMLGRGQKVERGLAGAQRGSAAEFEVLFRDHWPRAYRAAYLVVHDAAAAEDIAQEAFVSALRALDRFDRRRPFGPWLHRIVVNRSIDWARSRSLRRETSVDTVPEPAAQVARGTPDAAAARPGPDDEALGHPYSSELMNALAGLSPEHRAVIVLRFLLEHTPGEIAGMLDLPRGTVNSRLRRGLDRLAHQLEGKAR
jgi:RNA polymerase sigma-70 factor, ECF subfamily